jgi:hypothetical protein
MPKINATAARRFVDFLQILMAGRSYEAFWPHRGVEAVIYGLCNPTRRNSVDATIVSHDSLPRGIYEPANDR